MRQILMEVSLMKLIHETSHVINLFPNEIKSFQSEKKNSEAIKAIHVNVRI